MSIPLPETDNTEVLKMPKMRYDEYVLMIVAIAHDKSDIPRNAKRLITLSCYEENGNTVYDKKSVENQFKINTTYKLLKDEYCEKYKGMSWCDFSYHIVTDQEAVLNFVNPNMDKEI